MTIPGPGRPEPPLDPAWVARSRAWWDSLTLARDPEPGSAGGQGGKVHNFHGMTPESAARMVARIEARRELERSATTEIQPLPLLPAPEAPTDGQRPPRPGLQFVNGPWEPRDDGTPAPYQPTLPPPSTSPAPSNNPSPLKPVVPSSPAPTYGQYPDWMTNEIPSLGNSSGAGNNPTPQQSPQPAPAQPSKTPSGPSLGRQPLEVGIDTDGNPQLVVPVQGPEGVSRIVFGPDGYATVIDPDGTETPVNSYGIAPPRRTHANQMFDPDTGRWITPPETPKGLAPELRHSPWREAITSALSVPPGQDPTGSPEVVVHADGSMEVRTPRGGSDGADRPWTDVRVINAAGREIAHYREGLDGYRYYPLGGGHSVTVGPDGKVLDPPHTDRSPLYSLSPPDRHGKIGYIEHDGWTTALEPIPLPTGVPGQALYAHDGRLIIRDNNGKYHWVDATPETLPPTPAQRSIHLPWDSTETNSYQGPGGTWFFNVNGHKVAFTPDQKQVIDPANALRPTGAGGIYIDDRPGHRLQSIIDNIPSKPIPVPDGVPAAALYELADGRLVIVDRQGGNHYVSPLPAPSPEGWRKGLIHAFMDVASAYGGRRGGWANPERPPLGGGPTTRSSTLDDLQATFGKQPDRPAQLEQTLSVTQMLPPEQIRFTQRSISRETSDGLPIHELAKAMAEVGWRGNPIHAVIWEDGGITSLDNRRVRAARMAGLDQVPTAVHAPSDRLADWSHEWDLPRRQRNALGVDIRELPDGTLRVGGDVGTIRYHRGQVAETWGEIALFRAAEQRSLLPGVLRGSNEGPVYAAKPARTVKVELRAEDMRQIVESVAAARPAADRILNDLRETVDAVTKYLGPRSEPPKILGEDYRVKSEESLARKFYTERKSGEPVGDFLGRVNDLVRFSVQLPGRDHYLASMDATLGRLRARGYEVIDVKNFWQAGNRYYGMNTTLRAPDGRLFELQFPTAVSWRANKLTHEYYEVFRREDEPIERRVHAFLHTLRINNELGLAARIPAGIDNEVLPTDTGFSKWVRKNPEEWRRYLSWLDENGRDLQWVTAQFGLNAQDLLPEAFHNK